MARLPQPGGDDNIWGSVLNDFLSTSHNTDGTLKNGAVHSGTLSAGSAVSGQVLSYDGSDLSWSTPTGSGTVPDATVGVKGLVQLTGDLGGTAGSPTVPGLATKADTSALSAHTTNTSNPHAVTKTQVGLSNVDNTADTAKPVSTAQQTALNLKANLASPTFTGTVTVPTPTNNTDAATKAYVDTAASAGTPDANASTKGKVQLAGDLGGTAASPTVPGLALKANLASPTFTGVVTVPTPTNNTDAATKAYVDTTASSGTPDANASTKGKVQLAGDLSGTAASPTVPGLALKANLASPTFTGVVTVPTPTNNTDAATKAYVDTTASAGTPDANSTTKGKVQLAGDLGGTAASPTVPGLASKANTVHTHAATDIASGTVATARLGSGTANTTTYLRGDNTWVAPTSSVATATDATIASPVTGEFLGYNTATSKWQNSTLTGYAALASAGGQETVSTLNGTGATTLNLNNGNIFNVTLTGNTVFTFSGATAGKACSFALYKRQDATGSRTVTWPGSVKWSGGAPTLTTTANSIDILVFETLDGGTTWFGSVVGTNFS